MAAAATLQQTSNPSQPVGPEDVKTSPDPAIPPKYTDSSVLSIIVQDFDSASAWLADNRWPLQWNESDKLYQSPRMSGTFENSSVTRANVSRFTVAKQVNSLAPAIAGAVFSDATPFEIRPRPNVRQNTARAWKELIAEELDDINFKQECTYGIQGMVNQGTVIFKAGWETETNVETHYRRKVAPPQVDLPLGPPLTTFTQDSDEFEAVEAEITRNLPTFEKCELGTVFVDPTWKSPNQIWKAKFIIHQNFLNYNDLQKLRQNADYDIPSDAVLRAIFIGDQEQTEPIDEIRDSLSNTTTVHHAAREDFDYSEDPLLKPIEILEWYDKRQIRVCLNQKCVIRNGPHKMPDKPFFSANYWDIDDAGFGMGVGRIAGADQRVEQGMINAILDILAFAVQPEYAIARGANVPTQEQRRRLGGIRLIDGADATRAIALVPQPQVPPDTWRAIQSVVSTSENATGSDMPTVQGSIPGRGSSIVRSGTGAAIVGQASSTRLQSPVERFIDGVFLPFLKFLWHMNRERMPISEIRAILGERATDLVVDFADFFEASVKFDTLAGTRLAARNRMAQALPFLLQVFSNPALVEQLAKIGKKVNVLELTQMVLDMSEWKNQNDLIQDMTPQELQMMMQQNPVALKAQSEMMLQQQKHQNDMELKDKEIAGDIAKRSIDTTHQAAVKSPLERAAWYAQRLANERDIRASQYYAPQGAM